MAAVKPPRAADTVSTGCVGQPHVDGRKGLGLRQLDQVLAAEFEHGDERHHQHGHTALGVEQLVEFHEAAALQAPQHLAHVFAHGELLARDLVVLIEARASHDVGPRCAQVVQFDVREARLRALLVA